MKFLSILYREIGFHLVLGYRLLCVLFVFSLCRIAFYLFNREYFPETTWEGLLSLLQGGTVFDLSAILYTNLLFIFLCLLPFRFRYQAGYQKVSYYLFMISNAIAILANCIDLIYFRFTLRRTTASIFEEFGNETNVGELLSAFLIDYWYAALCWVVFVLVLSMLYKLVKLPNTHFSHSIGYIGLHLALGVGIAYLTVGGLRGGFRHSTRPITLNNAGEYVKHIKEINIVLNTPFAIYRTLGKHTLAKINFYPENELNALYNPIHKPNPTIPFKKENVVILIIESFGKEYSGFFNKHLENGNYKGFTPFMDSLAAHSLTFEYSFANGRKSIDAMPSVLASIPAIKEPYVLSHYSSNKINGIASLLRKKNYYTAFFHGAPNGSMGFQSFANIAGFEHYVGKNEYGKEEDFDGIWGIWDDKFLDFYVEKINTMPQPFLTAFFSVSSHHPFKVPQAYENRFPKGNLEIHQCIGYTDEALRNFFAKASQMDWFDNTLFVITADHTSQSYYPEYQTSAGYYAVPILFYKPNSIRPEYRSTIAQQNDILPTVLGYLGYDEPFVAFGRNLLDTLQKPLAVNYVHNTYQLFMHDHILQRDEQQVVGLYNFKTDKMLTQNLLAQKPPVLSAMDSTLKAFIQQYNNRMIEDKLTVKE